jgi:DNA ligase-1
MATSDQEQQSILVPMHKRMAQGAKLDGTSLLKEPLLRRRELLHGLNLPAPLSHAEILHAASADEIDAHFRDIRSAGHEGLLIKDPSSHYQPGRRGLAWIKLKKRLATLDVVVTAVEYGHGKRRGVLSDYTFAVRDEKTGALATIGKAYTARPTRQERQGCEQANNASA